MKTVWVNEWQNHYLKRESLQQIWEQSPQPIPQQSDHGAYQDSLISGKVLCKCSRQFPCSWNLRTLRKVWICGRWGSGLQPSGELLSGYSRFKASGLKPALNNKGDSLVKQLESAQGCGLRGWLDSGVQQDPPGLWFLHLVIQPHPKARSSSQTHLDPHQFPDPPAGRQEAAVGEKILTYLVHSKGSFRRARMLISQKSFFLLSCCRFLNYGWGWQYTDSFQPKPHASPNTCANTHTHTRERENELPPKTGWMAEVRMPE